MPSLPIPAPHSIKFSYHVLFCFRADYDRFMEIAARAAIKIASFYDVSVSDTLAVSITRGQGGAFGRAASMHP